MKVSDLFIDNKKEAQALLKLKLPIKKSTEKLLLSKPTSGHTYYYSLIQLWRGKIIERVFATRINNKKKVAEYQEVLRRIEGNKYVCFRNLYLTCSSGYHTVWENSTPLDYYFWKEKYYNIWFVETGYNLWSSPLFTMNDLENIDPSLKYCAWDGQPIISWVTLYRKYPEIEILGKLHRSSLISNTRVLEKLKDKKFKKFLCRLKGDFYASGKVVLYAYKNNLSIEDTKLEMIINALVNNVRAKYPIIPKEPLFKYFKKYYKENNHHINCSSYIDMIRAEEYLSLDLTLEKNIFPHDFHKWHDHYTKQMKVAKSKAIDDNIAAQVIKYHKLEKEVEDLKITLATCTQDLINEGKALNHCVGRMSYNEKMAEGKTLILFVRKEKEQPLYTMEFDPLKRKIIQFYGYDDKPVPIEDRQIIDTKWLPKVKRLKFA